MLEGSRVTIWGQTLEDPVCPLGSTLLPFRQTLGFQEIYLCFYHCVIRYFQCIGVTAGDFKARGKITEFLFKVLRAGCQILLKTNC